jgi:hypothetical protein
MTVGPPPARARSTASVAASHTWRTSEPSTGTTGTPIWPTRAVIPDGLRSSPATHTTGSRWRAEASTDRRQRSPHVASSAQMPMATRGSPLSR